MWVVWVAWQHEEKMLYMLVVRTVEVQVPSVLDLVC